jgi:flagellar biosynthetic protein FliR
MSPTSDALSMGLRVFVRMSFCFAFLPPFGGRPVPATARAGLAALFTVLLTAWLPPGARLPPDLVGWTLSLSAEAVVGLALAGMWSLFIAGLQTAGHLAGLQMGLGMATLYDPSQGSSEDVMGQLQRLVGLLIFFAVDGHWRLLELAVRSFEWAPAGAVTFQARTAALWGVAFGEMLTASLRLAAPVVAALWLLTAALGLIGRAAPSINLLALDFPLRIIVGGAVMAMSFPHGARVIETLLDRSFLQIAAVLKSLGG